ncbi:hypothetical protein GALMADRAFT_71275 [Galerina marginata CBS 339.88]|uniref:t-SNARE coiled-coil homology domain-containing protein n=1 Tax=Galerina marginata (strain CBS 339.88) TaxID=685588 RepID=A0A067ST16_GALM3|nr:hypothetical protein GALMADRAFT_71275 [Galerina marginata CBS 339.88]
MTNVRDNGMYSTTATPTTGGDMSTFYNEISSIQDTLRIFNDNVARISDLHSRSLDIMDNTASQQNAAQLDGLVDETSLLGASLKNRVKALEAQGGPGRDGQVKKQQAAFIKSKFVAAIQNYQSVEQQYRSKYKERMGRQFKIVKPDATPDEIRAVVNDEQGGQVFSQAVMNTNYAGSRAAYREVQERHEDVKRIERTLTELAQLFNDMSVLVEQQEETVDAIQNQAIEVEKDTEAGAKHVDEATEHARRARQKRWICFFIILVILIIVGVVVGIEVHNLLKKKH